MNTNYYNARRRLVSLLSVSLLLPLQMLADGSDDFNNNTKDTAKWGDDAKEHVNSLGVLVNQNQRLEFIVNTPLSDGDTLRPWKLHRFPVDANWTVQVDVFNGTVPVSAGPFQVNSAGFTLIHPTTAASELYLEFYAVPFAKAVNVQLSNGNSDVGDAETNVSGDGPVSGVIRMEFNGATKVVTCLYDADISNGYQWTQLGSFGVGGAGGATANTDWNLSTGQQFAIWVYGYSENMTINSGALYLDNFAETGGVPPTGGPAPVPVGSFQFKFPTNNPLLTIIADVTGNYAGVKPGSSQRAYNVDVAQDEQGKLSAMGRADGIAAEGSDTNTPIAGSVGKISTVNNEPTVALKGTFKGTQDGVPATGNGSARGPVKLEDIGGGTNVVEGTSSFKAQVGDVPYLAKNEPLQLEVPPSHTTNLHKDWSLQLDINQKVVDGKEVTVASAQLMLPNGDAVSYPERMVKYSTTKGYKLLFKKGTNTTIIPNRIDPKSSVSIQGLTFVQQGADWQPTGGTINYQFLGQKGAANLMDFLAP